MVVVVGHTAAALAVALVECIAVGAAEHTVAVVVGYIATALAAVQVVVLVVLAVLAAALVAVLVVVLAAVSTEVAAGQKDSVQSCHLPSITPSVGYRRL